MNYANNNTADLLQQHGTNSKQWGLAKSHSLEPAKLMRFPHIFSHASAAKCFRLTRLVGREVNRQSGAAGGSHQD